MRRSTSYFACGLALLLALGGTPLVAASFEGRVFEIRDGRQVWIEGARVEIQRNDGTLATGYSDSEGRYLLKGLPDSRLTVTASRPGWKTMRAGPRARSELVFDCSAGGSEDRVDICASVDFELSRGAVVTGQVFDEFGEPAIGTFVHLYRLDPQHQSQIAGGSSHADDRGVYRIGPVAPGQYAVRAEIHPSDLERQGFEYAPASAVIRVESEAEVRVPPFTLELIPKFRVSGRVEGLPIGENRAVGAHLVPTSASGYRDRYLTPQFVDSEGRFSGWVLPSGWVEFWMDSSAQGEPYVFLGSFEISRDTDDLVLTPGEAAHLSGRVIWEGEPPGGEVNIFLYRPAGGRSIGIDAVPPDLTFSRGMPPGEYVIRQARDGYVRVVTEGDTRLPEGRMTLRPREHREVTIVVTNQFAIVSGTVRTAASPEEESEPAAHYEVVLENGVRTWTTATDQFGYYIRRNLPADDYTICAFKERPSFDPATPGSTCAIARHASRISAEAGTEAELSLTAER